MVIAYDGPEAGRRRRDVRRQRADQGRAAAATRVCGAAATTRAVAVDVLGVSPGVFSAYWAGHKKDATANLELLLDSCRTSLTRIRTAQFVSVIALVRPDGGVAAVEGRVAGASGASAPAGPGGFGYDPIFIPDGQTAGEERTVGEWTAAEKNAE